MNIKRLKKLQTSLLHPILIKKKENLQYLTGESFSNVEGYLLVNPHTKLTNKNIKSNKVSASYGVGVKKNDVVFFGSGLEKVEGVKKVDRVKNIKKYLNSKRLDIEYAFTYGEGKYLKDKLPGVKIEPVISQASVNRQIKEPAEIGAVKKSMQIVEKVFGLVKKEIKKPGMTEVKLANFIQTSGLKMGAHDVSFPAIVACGANAAVPHHVASSKVLKAGESIIIDFGFKYKNYCSDFTRTVFLKSVPKKLEIVYNHVEKAYNESIYFAKAGVKAGAVYQKSVDVLAEKKLDKYFIHSLGHGTGLEIHELPNLSPNSKDILKNNMVFSIEPGVYLPKIGGIRIEDLVYMQDGICKKFINVSTKLSNNII